MNFCEKKNPDRKTTKIIILYSNNGLQFKTISFRNNGEKIITF